MTDDPIAFTFFNKIGIIDQLATTMFERVLPKGMTVAQFGVLNHYVRLNIKEKSPADLAATFQVTRGTMTSTLARLQRAGLVKILPDPKDGRAKRVCLTDRGKAMRQQCIAAIEPLMPVFDELAKAADVESLVPALDLILTKLESLR